jgi:hypothetical protein
MNPKDFNPPGKRVAGLGLKLRALIDPDVG